MHVNIFKKKEVSEKQLSMREKKHQANLRKNGGLYFQIGLILSLFMVFGLFQLKFEKKEMAYHPPKISNDPIEISYPDNYVVEEDIRKEEVVQETKPNQPRPEDMTDFIEKDNSDDVKETVFNTEKPQELDKGPSIDDIQVIEEGAKEDPIPVNLVQSLPVFPGCEKYSDKKKQLECFSKKIAKHINKKFDTDIAAENGISGKQRVNVSFVIDKSGNVVDVQARAPHPALQKEAIKAVNSLPKMTPAKQGYKDVPVRYALPISFRVSD